MWRFLDRSTFRFLNERSRLRFTFSNGTSSSHLFEGSGNGNVATLQSAGNDAITRSRFLKGVRIIARKGSATYDRSSLIACRRNSVIGEQVFRRSILCRTLISFNVCLLTDVRSVLRERASLCRSRNARVFLDRTRTNGRSERSHLLIYLLLAFLTKIRRTRRPTRAFLQAGLVGRSTSIFLRSSSGNSSSRARRFVRSEARRARFRCLTCRGPSRCGGRSTRRSIR